MKFKLLRKHYFTLFEICISLAILIMLTSSMSYLGYSTLKQYRIANGKKAFINYLTILHHKNCLQENHLFLHVSFKKEHIETFLGGNTSNLSIKNKKRSFCVGPLFENNHDYTIEIQARSLPNEKTLTTWIKNNNSTSKIYYESLF